MIRSVPAAAGRALALLAATSLIVFWATELLPSDAAESKAAGRATGAQLAALRAELGLDRPAWERYLSWAGGLAHGDAGTSLVTGRPVGEMLAERLPATLTLAGCALAVAVPLALVLAWRVGAAPHGRIAALTAVAAAVPQPVFAAALVALFAGTLPWLPPVSLLAPDTPPLAQPELLVLPALALALPSAAFGAGMLGGAVADTLRRSYVRDAAARGLPPARVALRHVAPLLAAPALRILALLTGGLLASTAVIEVMFGYSGLGELLVSAIGTRDLPVVQAVAMLTAATVLSGLATADVLAARHREEPC
ncbi:ABC transporter permease [Actinocorallia populi]|uniref:ABC transporter permease n=1 Tax=Actinocorallia populi TaxID=2079200 RepID=UPI0018E4EBA2|nr:ABC transporter permease [Actinocorallia populi]